MTSGQTSLEQMLGVYKWVVDDVIKNVREDFLNEGADSQVLEDLKQLWENKLVQSGALSRPVRPAEPPPTKDTKHDSSTYQQPNKHTSLAKQLPTATTNSSTNSTNTSSASVIQQAPPRSTPTSTVPPPLLPPPLISTAQIDTSNDKGETTSNVMSQVATASQQGPPQLLGMNFATLAQQQAALYSAMAGGGASLQPLIIPGAAGLPTGSIPLIQHNGIPYAAVPTANGLSYIPITSLNLAAAAATTGGNQQQQQQQAQNNSSQNNNISQSDGPLPVTRPGRALVLSCGASKKKKDVELTVKIPQLDGPPDGSSSDESEDSSESDVDDIEDDTAENEEEPLNSNDDAESDEEEDVWETENTIVCQFEKVYRVRSKWKFSLKDGIMHLKGHDYIFTKTTGEAEW